MKRHWRTTLALTATVGLTLTVTGQASAENPIITTTYTADPAALVVGNTLYIYAGHDEARQGANFVMRDWSADRWLSTSSTSTPTARCGK